MVSLLPRVAIVAALASSIGLHWGFLQSVAWMGMVVNYSQNGSVSEALAKTFDGKHPCALCKAISTAKKSEKKSEFPATGKKFEFSYSRTLFVFSAPTYFWMAGAVEENADLLNHSPPVPPPKSLLG
ncbi:MAG TPA: hypothetical protein VGW37_11815 [Terriglobia bacterium]|nr:hypothetical protein [Terriglobia bacterium]